MHLAKEYVCPGAAAASGTSSLNGTIMVCTARCLLSTGCKEDEQMLVTMEPILSTIHKGLGDLGATCAGQTSPFGKPLLHCGLRNLRSGDSLIWVGIAHAQAVPWRRLGQAGVRRIFYHADPMPPVYYNPQLQLSPLAVLAPTLSTGNSLLANATKIKQWSRDGASVFESLDEVWHYSRLNARVMERTGLGDIDQSAASAHASAAHRIINRYVPPGKHVFTSAKERSCCEDGAGRSMTFVGQVHAGVPARLVCYLAVDEALHDSAAASSNRTTLGSLRLISKVMTSVSRVETHMVMFGQVHLNMHKFCASEDAQRLPFLSVRVAKALSLGRVVISQRSDPEDEAEFAGLVSFVGERSDPSWFEPSSASKKQSCSVSSPATWYEREPNPSPRHGSFLRSYVSRMHSARKNLPNTTLEDVCLAKAFARAVSAEAARLAALSPQEFTRLREERHAAFEARFAPRAILRRAGVGDALLCSQHNPRAK